MNRQELRSYLAANGRTPRLVCNFNEKEFPFIIMSETQKLDTMCLRIELRRMPNEQAFVIGRSSKADYKTLGYSNLSRIHCFILKDGENYALYDVSKGGTRVINIVETPYHTPSLVEKIKDFFLN